MSAPRSILTVAFSVCALSGLVPTAAEAYATVAPPPSASPSSGLPDGRVYELASPFNKHGYQAGAKARAFGVNVEFSMASPDGNAVAYRSDGPAADTNSSGLSRNFVAERTIQGWKSRSTTARGLGQNEETSIFTQDTAWTDYSPDLSHLAYGVTSSDVPDAPAKGTANLYLMGSDPLEQPTWLLNSLAGTSLENLGDRELVGMSPDASVIYFAYEKHLLPQDASRSGWGVYESRDGTVTEAGLLPDGSVPTSGAMPFATATPATEGYRQGQANPASFDNQVSEDGMRLFFASSGQIYVHKIELDGSEHSVLVSASKLPGHIGEKAPDGTVQFENLTKQAEPLEVPPSKSKPTYGYASPDGVHVFFQSIDRLTSSAPTGTELKTYDFNVDSGHTDYLPSVSLGGIVTASKDGSSFVFESGNSSPPELDMWRAGSGGGNVTPIAQLPGGGFVGPGRMADNDMSVVFQAQAPVPGFNNAESEQVYRYDVKANELACISCPPVGVSPSGSSYLSAIDQYGDVSYSIVADRVVNDARGLSSDGSQIFFASPDPLVTRDTNGDFDTYEWENGTVFLISSGTGPDYSLFLDNSDTGGDVFFATSDELVQGDNDAGFDVYDARTPHPGDNPPPSAVPCSGDVCQGPPSVGQLLGAPPSATFTGVGDIVYKLPANKSKSTTKTRPQARKLASALGACRKRKSGHRRVMCERKARKRYPAVVSIAERDGGRGN